MIQSAEPTYKQPRIVSTSQASLIKASVRRRGCFWSIFVALLLAVFACISTFALYIVVAPSSVDILVMGLDSRGVEGTTARTDSIMLAGFQPSKLRVSLLSIPRDLFIDVPDYGMQRINTINVLGERAQSGSGPDLLRRSIARNFNIEPERYIRLDFQAFVALVDAIGGINIEVPSTFVDYQFPTPDYGTELVRFEAGWQHMDGATALKYARTRHADDDYQRAARQQRVVRAVGRKLLNPLTWPAALGVLNRHIETDLNLLDLLVISPPVLFSMGNFEMLVINRDFILPAAGYSVPNYEVLAPWLAARFD